MSFPSPVYSVGGEISPPPSARHQERSGGPGNDREGGAHCPYTPVLVTRDIRSGVASDPICKLGVALGAAPTSRYGDWYARSQCTPTPQCVRLVLKSTHDQVGNRRDISLKVCMELALHRARRILNPTGNPDRAVRDPWRDPTRHWVWGSRIYERGKLSWFRLGFGSCD